MRLSRHPCPFPPLCASAWGDDRFGLWFEITLPGINEAGATQVVQRLRWIEPGSFPMGSPTDEAERNHDEGPRHRVTLTEGFWLADTACTQALWQALMGENPSHFKGQSLAEFERPVEQVSWNAVQGFLTKLQALLPGVQATLPTEAQWEYACRAGSEGPFSFGDNITPQQVNYEGTFPYNGGLKGEFRKQTLPVKSLPANAWGLYEMHGNVWEWCADGLRSYSDAHVVDPVGPGVAMASGNGPGDDTNTKRDEGGPPALRGGSWGSFAKRVRSACREAYLPGDTDVFIGFRVALRPTGTGHPKR